jgi:DNA-binding LacI/PurR family transcriptional regulator
MVTLAKLAAELGLSVAAVSMALRNHPRIAEATRRRVQEAARAAGYVVHPALSRRGATRAGGPGRPAMPLAYLRQANPGYPLRLPSAEPSLRASAAALGYALATVEVPKDMSPLRFADVLHARGIEALLVGPLFDAVFVETFPWERFSAAACHAGLFAPPCHIVMTDITAATADAYRRCVVAGYRRIAFAQIPEQHPPVDELDRYGAVELCRSRAARDGVAVDARDFTSDERPAFGTWVRDFQPDVLVGQTPLFYWMLREAGLLGQPVRAFITLRISEQAQDGWISGYVEDYGRLGQLSCQLIDAQVRAFQRGPPPTPARLLVGMPWRDGTTFGPRPTDGSPVRGLLPPNPPSARAG